MIELAKALADIPVGEKALQHGKNAYDYSHILEEHHKQALPGAKILVHFTPNVGPPDDPTGWIRASLVDGSGKHLGDIHGEVKPKDSDKRKFFLVSTANVRGAPRRTKAGRSLYFGRKLYEAAFAHAKNALGATHGGGGTHSTYASLANRWLSDRHGMLYDPNPNIEGNEGFSDPAVRDLVWGQYPDEDEWGYEGQPPATDDDRYGPYAYTLKSELSKTEWLQGDKVKDRSVPLRAEHFDYDHLLSETQRQKGYRLEVSTYPGAKGPGLVRARVYAPNHKGPHSYASKVEGVYSHPAINITYAHTADAHQGENLGRAAYEALMFHMKNSHGASELRGLEHTARADRTIQNLAYKHKLAWGIKPTRLASDGGDAMYSEYALKLHEAVTDGPFELPLAKEEPGIDDPLRSRIDSAIEGYRPDVGELKLLTRENGFAKNHLAYLMKKIAEKPSWEQPWDLMGVPLFHPLMGDDVLAEANSFLGEGHPRKMLRRMVLKVLADPEAYDTPEVVAQAPWTQNKTGWVFDQLLQQNKDDLEQGTTNGLRTLYDFTVNNFDKLTPEQHASIPLNYTDGLRVQRKNVVDRINQFYFTERTDAQGNVIPPPPMPTELKTAFLNYAKKLFSAAEKTQRTTHGRGGEIISEFKSTQGILRNVVSQGLPPEFLKGRMAKNLFTALLSQAPNFPPAKAQIISDYLMSEDFVKKVKNDEVRLAASKLVFSNPHLTQQQWENAVLTYHAHVPYVNIVENPRFNDDFAERLWATAQGDHELISAMRHSNKLTPPFVEKVLAKSLPPDRKAEVEAKQREDLERHAANPQPGWSVDNGILKNSYGAPSEAFSQNPYSFNDYVPQTLSAVGYDKLTPEFFQKYVQRYKDMYNYVPPGVDEGMRGLWTRYWGQSWDHGQYDAPFAVRIQAGGAGINPEGADLALAQFLVDSPKVSPSDYNSASGWLNTVKDESSIQHILRNTTKSKYIQTLLGRADAKPEWIAAVESRPEFLAPPGPEDARYQHRSTDNTPRRFRELGERFHQNLKASVIASPGFPPERLASMLDNVNDFATAHKLVTHKAFNAEGMKTLLEKIPGGNVPWSRTEQGRLIADALASHPNEVSPEIWQKIYDRGYLSPTNDSEYNRRIINRFAKSSHATTELTNKLFDEYKAASVQDPNTATHVWYAPEQFNALLGSSRLGSDKIINEIDNVSPDAAFSTFKKLIDRDTMAPDVVQKLIEKAESLGPAVPDWNPQGRHGTYWQNLNAGPQAQEFWNALAHSPFAPTEWIKDTLAKVQSQQVAIDQHNAVLPVGHRSRHDWNWMTPGWLGDTLQKIVVKQDPDIVFKQYPKVGVRPDAQPYRLLRDWIESQGGQVHINAIQNHPKFKKLKVNEARVLAEITPEQLAKIPEKNRPPPGTKKKTDFISSEGVQKIIDAMPVTAEYNPTSVEWSRFPQQMSNPSGKNQVFQMNLSTGIMNKLKEAGLLHILHKLQEGPLAGGGIHPMRPGGTTLGWVRHYGVQPDNTLTVDEVQCDVRPPGGSWVVAEKGFRGTLPGQTEKWKSQALANIINRWDVFPAEDVDKAMHIMFGGKDPHQMLMEAFVEHLRSQGHHNVKIRYPGAGLQSAQRYGGWAGIPPEERPNVPIPPPDQLISSKGAEHAPIHIYETHDTKLPPALAMDQNASQYGEVPSEPTDQYKGWPMHTVNVAKKEPVPFRKLMKAIDTLPTLPYVRSDGGERIYDASHYLTPDHRRDGYRMDVRSGTGIYGDYSVVNVYHGSDIVGGASSFITDNTMEPGRKYVQPEMVGLKDQHVGRGLGLPMYEALYASAKKHHGATHARGLPHSSPAHSVHQKLAEKHGLKYAAEPNVPSAKYPTQEDWESAPNLGMDGKWGPYQYTL